MHIILCIFFFFAKLHISSDHYVVVAGVLQHYQAEFAVRCNHDLVLLGADAHEGDVLLSVQTLNGGLRLRVELSDEGAVLNGFVLAHG